MSNCTGLGGGGGGEVTFSSSYQEVRKMKGLENRESAVYGAEKKAKSQLQHNCKEINSGTEIGKEFIQIISFRLQVAKNCFISEQIWQKYPIQHQI